MEWRDEGTLIGSWPYGETSAVVEVFTADHGRHAGVVRGGASRRMAASLQPGTQVQVTWRGRLNEQLGTFALEPLKSRAGFMDNRLALAGLSSLCAMVHLTLPERAAHAGLYRLTQALLGVMESKDSAAWLPVYVRWEMSLLEEAGFGLDLSRCAVTGSRDDLAFVSPKTGRAVSRAGAGDWAGRLLPLPQGLLGQGPLMSEELQQALALTGHFLERGFASQLASFRLPEARVRLVSLAEKV